MLLIFAVALHSCVPFFKLTGIFLGTGLLDFLVTYWNKFKVYIVIFNKVDYQLGTRENDS